jgi:predicted DNA-binding transcriptional regulator YafY
VSEAELIRAVGERRVVELRRAGEPGVRVVQPHVVFRTEAGAIALNAHQVDGWSRQGDLPGWRTFELSSIEALRVLEERFELAPGYDPASPRYRHGVLAAV